MPASDDSLLAMWNQRHAEAEDLGQVATVLDENKHLISPGMRVLDLASGRGINALAMARAGLEVTAWDLSPVAIKRLQSAADEEGLSIHAEVRDVIARPPEAESFDLILVSYFLDRSLAQPIVDALNSGGLLFYQTFSRNRVSDTGPSNPHYRLSDNELLALFQSLRVRVYREEGSQGDTSKGCRDIAMLVAEKP